MKTLRLAGKCQSDLREFNDWLPLLSDSTALLLIDSVALLLVLCVVHGGALLAVLSGAHRLAHRLTNVIIHSVALLSRAGAEQKQILLDTLELI